MNRVLELGDRIDEIIRSHDRLELLSLLATMKHREVLIQDAIQTPVQSNGHMQAPEAAVFFGLKNVRALYRAARVSPLREIAIWISPRRVVFPRSAAAALKREA